MIIITRNYIMYCRSNKVIILSAQERPVPVVRMNASKRRRKRRKKVIHGHAN